LVFPPDLRGFPSDTGPRFLAIPGSSFHELRLLYRVRHRFSPARRPQPTSSSLGSRSPSRHESVGSTYRWVSQAQLRSALSVSHTLDGLLPLEPCGLISSHCHVRDSVSGIFPSNQPAWLITSPCPHAVKRLSPAAELPLPRQLLTPRLQGFDPATGPLSPTGFLRLPTTRSPLKFSPLGSTSKHLGTAFTPPPLMTFPADSSSDADSWPPAYQSVLSLRTCLQLLSPWVFPAFLPQPPKQLLPTRPDSPNGPAWLVVFPLEGLRI
jgi:hypothetical protein